MGKSESSKNNSSLWKLSFKIGFFAHFYFKWCLMKADIFGIIFCVPSWSLVHTVNGISRQGLYREWTRQAGLSFYSKPMQTEWIVATVQRECLFVGLSGLYYCLKIVLFLVLKIISPSLLQFESFRNQHKNLPVIISRALCVYLSKMAKVWVLELQELVKWRYWYHY